MIYLVAAQVGIQTFSIYSHIRPHKYIFNLKNIEILNMEGNIDVLKFQNNQKHNTQYLSLYCYKQHCVFYVLQSHVILYKKQAKAATLIHLWGVTCQSEG